MAFIYIGIPTSQSLNGKDPYLPLVLYKPLSDIFVKLKELNRLHSSPLSAVTHANSSITGSIEITSGIITQPRPGGFILVTHPQVNMVGSFTRYPEFSGRGNDDVEQHWYLCDAIWRAWKMPDAGKLI